MLNIQVDENYKITSDGMQIIIQRKHIVDPTQSPAFNPEKHSSEKRIEWKTFKYCGKVSQAIDLILQQNIFESNARDLKELKNEIATFRATIEKQLN